MIYGNDNESLENSNQTVLSNGFRKEKCCTKDGAELVSIAYFFSAWGDRAWEFASFMFILEVFPSTLMPASFFGFMEVFAGILTGSRIGRFVDNHDRLMSMRTSVLCQNAGVAAASILFYIAIQNKSSWSIRWKWFVLCGILPFAILAKLSSAMNRICIHKDWLRHWYRHSP